MLRNVVADDLARIGNAHAVVAAGLIGSEQEQEIPWVGTRSLGDLVARIRENAKSPFGDCVALFADLPTIEIYTQLLA